MLETQTFLKAYKRSFVVASEFYIIQREQEKLCGQLRKSY